MRNALLGVAVADIDIATPLLPEEVMRRLQKAGLGAVPTGIEHGTVTAIVRGKPFEVTTLRRDVETDGRRAVIAFTDRLGAKTRRGAISPSMRSTRAPDGDAFRLFRRPCRFAGAAACASWAIL